MTRPRSTPLLGKNIFFCESEQRCMANTKRICKPASWLLRSCTVSLRDIQEVEHSVDVTAETLYEAIAAALAALQKNNWVGELGQGLATVTVIVQQAPIKHEVKMKDFLSWLGAQDDLPPSRIHQSGTQAGYRIARLRSSSSRASIRSPGYRSGLNHEFLQLAGPQTASANNEIARGCDSSSQSLNRTPGRS